ncbi:MAG: head GIN domain-containing protein [Bacteroidales bacterium]
MKKIIGSSFIALALLVLNAGFAMGQSGKETRNLSDFKEVSFGISGNLSIKLGQDFSVVMEGDKAYLSEIETVVKDGRLLIRCNNWHMFGSQHADIFITMPKLTALGVSGSGKARIEDAVTGDAIDLNVSGSGKIVTGDINTNQLSSRISGSGDVIIEGSGLIQKGDLSISGSGSYKGDNLKFSSLEVGISGSGNCSCNVTGDLRASVSGSGSVWYSGNPRIDARTSGSGHVRSK